MKNPAPKFPSRPVKRREAFEKRNLALIAQYGLNLPRKVRRRIAWDSLKRRAA